MLARKLSSIAVVAVLSAVVASCGSSDSLTGPSHAGRAGGAVIIGRVMGLSATQRNVTGNSALGALSNTTLAKAAPATLTVSITGTNISTTVDGDGQFELTGVPPGDVTLKFSGAGADATITLTGVTPSQQITITVSLNGKSARLESEKRDDDEDQDEAEDELEGRASGVEGRCPSLTFTVQGTKVATNSATTFEHGQCSAIVNGTNVEVEFTRQADGTTLARKVDIK